MSTYAVLQIDSRSYLDIKSRVLALPQSDYGHMLDTKNRRVMFDSIAVEAAAPHVDGGVSERRDELARILGMIAKQGLYGPRDLDVALDAILSVFGAEHDTDEAEAKPDEPTEEFVNAIKFTEIDCLHDRGLTIRASLVWEGKALNTERTKVDPNRARGTIKWEMALELWKDRHVE